MIITATTDGDTTYQAIDDDTVIAEMLVNADRIIQNIEVNEDRRGEGIARALWDYANAESPVLHQVEHHRTWEGNAFAEAVGGDTATADQDFNEHCNICTGWVA